MLRIVSTMIAAGLLLLPGQAFAEKRFALVIGNSAYQTVSVLPNPVNDAKALAEFLTTAGFEVGVAADLSQAEIRQAVSDFAEKLAEKGPDSVALVFFAGHGLQVDGDNFLIPVDARITREMDVPLQAVRLADVMNALAAAPSRTRIVILDACRNNPFSDIAKTTGRGLAIVDAPAGSIVAYATSPGSEAEDGTGSNSPFTSALLAVAREQGMPIEQVLKRVRLAVHQATDGRQTPYDSSSLTSDFFFFPPSGPGLSESARASARSRPKSVDAWRRDLIRMTPDQAYNLVIGDDAVEGYEAFLAVYGVPPIGPRVRALLDRRKELMAWYAATSANTVAGFQAFLTAFPASDLTSTAQRLLERARNRSLNANASALGVAALGGQTAPGAVPVGAPGRSCECGPAAPTRRAKPAQERRATAAPPKPSPQPRRPRGPTDDDVASGRAVPAGSVPPPIETRPIPGFSIGVGGVLGQPRPRPRPSYPR